MNAYIKMKLLIIPTKGAVHLLFHTNLGPSVTEVIVHYFSDNFLFFLPILLAQAFIITVDRHYGGHRALTLLATISNIIFFFPLFFPPCPPLPPTLGSEA